jgi:hypothetical protein
MPTIPPLPSSNALNLAKGWPHPAALDFTAKPSANVLYDLRAGQCCHLNSSGELEPGVANKQMPLFIFQGVNEYDVNTAGPAQGAFWVPVTPGGGIMCIVAKAGVEMETTEFVVSLTYAPNDLLKAATGNAASDEQLNAGRPTTSSSGCVRNDSITLYTTAVVGVVSRGVFTNYNNRSVLAFWPVYCPGTA